MLTSLQCRNALGHKKHPMCYVAFETKQPSYDGVQVDEIDVSIEGCKLWSCLSGQMPLDRCFP